MRSRPSLAFTKVNGPLQASALGYSFPPSWCLDAERAEMEYSFTITPSLNLKLVDAASRGRQVQIVWATQVSLFHFGHAQVLENSLLMVGGRSLASPGEFTERDDPGRPGVIVPHSFTYVLGPTEPVEVGTVYRLIAHATATAKIHDDACGLLVTAVQAKWEVSRPPVLEIY